MAKYCLRIKKDGKPHTDYFYEDFDEAVKWFKLNEKLGFQCAIYNFN